jgi:medium-chain acyl-[acyl-carrier-protein] hydrolase
VCLPYAGGGAAIYQPWWKALPPSIELWAARLPGRESRLGEAAFRDAAAVVAPLACALASAAPAPALAIYGHSMGGLLGFELAHALAARGIPVDALLVSGCRAPHLPPREQPLHTLDDEALPRQLAERYGGMPREVLDTPELLRLVLPTLRADLEVVESYRFVERPPGPWRLTAYGGVDDPSVPPAELLEWQRHTSAAFRLEIVAGSHFFIQENRAAVLRSVTRELERCTG